MNLIIISAIASIIVSFNQIIKASKAFLKNIFDSGYKVNPERLKEVNNFLNKISDGKASNLYIIFVPYINLYYSVIMTKAMENLNSEVFGSLLTMGVIE